MITHLLDSILWIYLSIFIHISVIWSNLSLFWELHESNGSHVHLAQLPFCAHYWTGSEKLMPICWIILSWHVLPFARMIFPRIRSLLPLETHRSPRSMSEMGRYRDLSRHDSSEEEHRCMEDQHLGWRGTWRNCWGHMSDQSGWVYVFRLCPAESVSARPALSSVERLMTVPWWTRDLAQVPKLTVSASYEEVRREPPAVLSSQKRKFSTWLFSLSIPSASFWLNTKSYRKWPFPEKKFLPMWLVFHQAEPKEDNG